MQKGSYPCPECKEHGLSVVYAFPTGLGTHRRAKHGIKGKTSHYYEKSKSKNAMPPTLDELVNKEVKEVHKELHCFYCSRQFKNKTGRSRHIRAAHKGMATETTTAVLVTTQKGSDANSPIESKEDKAIREYVINRAGYLEGLCHGMAATQNLPPEEFTAGIARYLYAHTLR